MFKKSIETANAVGKLVVGVVCYAAAATVVMVAAQRVVAAILEE